MNACAAGDNLDSSGRIAADRSKRWQHDTGLVCILCRLGEGYAETHARVLSALLSRDHGKGRCIGDNSIISP